MFFMFTIAYINYYYIVCLTETDLNILKLHERIEELEKDLRY